MIMSKRAFLRDAVVCVMLALMLMACGAPAPIETAPTIAATLPTTSTVEPRPTDRATATLPTTRTPIVIEPSATPPATKTLRPIAPTISAAHGAQIMAFDVAPARANPGDTVILQWQAQGDRATLCPDSRYALFTPADCVNVPVSGTHALVMPSDVKGNKTIEFVLTVSGAAGSSAKQGTSVAMVCPQTWFFSTEPQAGVCPQNVIRTQAAYQPFERGLMIWLKEPGRYFILEHQTVAPGDIRHPLSTVTDPLNITRNTEGRVQPPAGLFAPTSGFGLIWRGDVQQSTGFRDQLGWALQPESGYEATYQCDDATPSGGRVWQTCYLTLPDGQIIATLSTGAWFWREEQLQQGAPKILSFTANRTEARPGDTITLSWASIGGATATLLEPVCCTYTSSPVTTQPLNGSLSFELRTGVERDTFAYVLTVQNATASDSKTVRVRLPCPDRYFFTTTRDDLECPAAAPLTSLAVEQRFEHGRMIWLGSPRTIYVLFGSGRPPTPGAPPDGFLVFDDTWQPGEPESDPALTPPSGLLQPVRGFGKVWRSWPEVRDGLGWAVTPEQAFDGVYQRGWKTCLLQNTDGSYRSCSGPANDFQYLRAADGRVIRLTQFGVLGRHSVQQWEFWTP